MAILKIARMGHPVLASVAQPVAFPITADVRQLVADMQETLDDSGGVGLAAPQVHVPLRLILYRVPAARNDGQEVPLRCLINPELSPIGEDRTEDWEACLSLPGLIGRVPRHAHVHWRAVDLDGTPLDGEAEGFHARVLQHECDHLDGLLYPRRIKDLTAFGFVEEIKAVMTAAIASRHTG